MIAVLGTVFVILLIVAPIIPDIIRATKHWLKDLWSAIVE